MHHGLIERLQALQGGGPVLSAGTQVIEQAGVRGLKARGPLFPSFAVAGRSIRG